jgi:ADP-ribosylglycohydrolase
LFIAVAMLDALGNPLEGERVEDRIVGEMIPHTTANRAPGIWTDDTSIMLSIASALSVRADPEENRVEQIMALREWKDRGVLSSTGVCFNIRPQVKSAIEMFTQFDSNPDNPLHQIWSTYCGNNYAESSSGSLPRVLPLAISFWREPDQARIYGKLSSEIMHASLLPKEASSLLAYLIALILERVVPHPCKRHEEEEKKKKKLLKFTLIHEIAKFPFENNDLRRFLTVPYKYWIAQMLMMSGRLGISRTFHFFDPSQRNKSPIPKQTRPSHLFSQPLSSYPPQITPST